MNWRRFLGLEERASTYTDAVVEAIQSAAGDVPVDPGGLAALEIAAGQWSRGFASAEVSPQNQVTEAITPSVLAAVGRGLIREGEAVFSVDVDGGELRLRQAASWDIVGGSDPATWKYRLSLPGPSRTDQRSFPAESVLHFRFATSKAEPWKGIAPLDWARVTGKLSASLEQRLREESGSSVGYLLPVPGDGGSDNLDDLRRDLANLRGKVALVETVAGGWKEGRIAAPRKDWVPHRMGAAIPSGNVSLRKDTFEAVLACCGLPPSLAAGSADGTAQREAWRRFLHGTLQPVAKIIEAEVIEKLETPFTLSFRRLMASDLAGRARAFGALVNDSDRFTKEQAAVICGFVEP